MQEMNISVLWELLLNHIKAIAITMVSVAALLAVGTGLFVEDTYASQCTMYVMNISTDAAGNTSSISTSGLAASQQMVNEYITILRSNNVIGQVAKSLKAQNYELSVAEIRSTLSMQAVDDTAMLQIKSTTKDPLLSKAICDAILDCAPEKVTTVMLGLGSVSPVDVAENGVKVGPSILRNGVLGALVGLILSYGVFLLLHLLDNTIKEEKDLKQRFNVNVLGAVPDMNPGAQSKKKGGK